MICLTFDTDHMSGPQLRRWLAGSNLYGRGTFFCTELYDFLADTDHEVAPHPNLTPANWPQEIEVQRKLFPKAKSWRSHSLFFSQPIAVDLCRLGYDCVSVVEQFGDRAAAPYRLPWGPWQMPIYYMDNSDFCNFNDMQAKGHVPFSTELIRRAVTGDGLYVFDFHPIHLELNTPSYEFYSHNRDAFKGGGDPERLRFGGRGTRTFFDELMAAMRQYGEASVPLSLALEQWLSSESYARRA